MVVGRVNLRYYTTSGRQETIRVDTQIRQLNLAERDIVSIDLNPLEYCAKLRSLNLSSNFLQMIDLNPLCSLANLSALRLHKNKLDNLNITPLFYCDSLNELSIDNIPISADPTALYAYANSALMSQANLTIETSYEPIFKRVGWRTLLLNTLEFLRVLPYHHWYAAQKGLLSGFGIREIAAFDGDPKKILNGIPEDLDYSSAVNEIEDRVVVLLDKQISKGGSTHCLDIDEVSTTFAAKLIPSIIEMRKKEIEELKIEIIDGKADAKSIWFTYYGQRVLQQMGFKPYPPQNITLSQVLSAFEEVGLVAQTIKRKKPSATRSWENLSVGLQQYLEALGRGATLVHDKLNI